MVTIYFVITCRLNEGRIVTNVTENNYVEDFNFEFILARFLRTFENQAKLFRLTLYVEDPFMISKL